MWPSSGARLRRQQQACHRPGSAAACTGAGGGSRPSTAVRRAEGREQKKFRIAARRVPLKSKVCAAAEADPSTTQTPRPRRAGASKRVRLGRTRVRTCSRQRQAGVVAPRPKERMGSRREGRQALSGARARGAPSPSPPMHSALSGAVEQTSGTGRVRDRGCGRFMMAGRWSGR